jgi:outer membrane lipoprotein-sorting protein
MVPASVKSAAGALALVAMLVTAGVATGVTTDSAVQPSRQPSGDAATSAAPTQNGTTVVANVTDRLTTLDSLVATQEQTVAVDDGNGSTSETRLWIDFEDGQMRREVVESSYGSGSVTVRNESKTVTYMPEENRYTSYDTRGNITTFLGVLTEDSEMTYEGTETVDGESTHRLGVTPDSTRGPDSDATLWVDAETYFPTKVIVTTETERSSYEVSMDIRNVTLNADIDESRFRLDMPENATSLQSESELETYDSLDDLRAAANRTVPSPEMPDEYSFEQAHLREGGDSDLLLMRYANDTDEYIRVSERSTSGYNYSESDSFDSVEIHNQTGWYGEFGDSAVVTWSCDDTTYSVYGPLSKDGLTDIAASIDC